MTIYGYKWHLEIKFVKEVLSSRTYQGIRLGLLLGGFITKVRATIRGQVDRGGLHH